MATYRVLALIPTAADVPGVGVQTAAEAEVARALNAAAQFPAAMATYSAGMCEIDLSIRVLSDTCPASVYEERSGGQQYIQPNQLANAIRDYGYYDVVAVLNPPALTTATTFRGLGGSLGGIPYMWVKVGDDELNILVHEFGHAMTVYLETVRGEYTNFPSCAPEPAMHCAVDYGYPDDNSAPWFTAFFQGTISDGTGINAEGWAVATPTETGAAARPSGYRPLPSPWGPLGVLRIS